MRRRQLLFLLPGLLLVAALLVGGRLRRKEPEAAAPARAVHAALYGLSPVQRDVLAGHIRALERTQERLNWIVGNIAWLKRQQLAADVMSCELDTLVGQVPVVPAGDLTPNTSPAEPCAPQCGRIGGPRCPGARPTAWPQLEHSVLPSLTPPPPPGAPVFVKRTAAITQTRERQQRQLADLTQILPDGVDPARIRAIVECTADASGVRLDFVEIGTMRPLPDLGPGWQLRQVAVHVRVTGPRVAVARFMGRLAHRPEILSAQRAFLLSTEDPNLVVLEADLLLYVLKPR